MSTDLILCKKEFGETLSAVKTGWRIQEFEQSDATCVPERAGAEVQPMDNLALSNRTDNRMDGYKERYQHQSKVLEESNVLRPDARRGLMFWSL